MNVRLASTMLAAAALLVAPLFVPSSASAQKKYTAPTGPAPRLANGKPDFSGVWQTPRMADITKDTPPCCKGAGELPYTAWGKAQWDAYDASKGDYAGSCLPFGLFRSVGGPHPVQIIQNDKYIAFMWEQNTWFHVTPIGKQHPKDPEPTWFGNSVANWDGDTLVIDTIAFNGKTRLDTDGHPMSDQMHAIERYNRRDMGHIDYVLTIDDPKTYTKKWDSVRVWTLRTDWEIMEYSCEENNKDLFEGHIGKGVSPEAK